MQNTEKVAEVRGETLMNNSSLCISCRAITQSEYSSSRKAIKLFPDLSFLKYSVVQHLTECYVAEIDGVFAGFCGIQYGRGWWKLGPIVVLPEFQKHGVGSALLLHVVEKSKNRPTYFGTSNIKIKEYGRKIGAKEIGSFFSLPWAIKLAAIGFLFEYLSLQFLWESLRKFFRYGRGKYTYFLLPGTATL